MPFFFKSLRLRLSPARVSMIISASSRKSADMPSMDGEIRSSTYGPSTMPIISIPSRGGSLIFEQIEPNSRALKQITASEVKKTIKTPLRGNKKSRCSA